MLQKYLKISEFATLSGIPRSNLIFYNRIGLLCPEMVDESNGYRYYSYRQIDIASVITVLREIGMPLKEIKSYLSQRSPYRLEAIFNEQREELENRISKLKKFQDLIDVRLNMTRESFQIVADQILLETHLNENLFLGPQLPKMYDVKEGWRYLPDFYKACLNEDISVGFPVGSLVLQEAVQSGQWNKPAYYYYCLSKERYSTNFVKPQGTYLVGYANTDYGFTDALYKKLIAYMEHHNLIICGNAYEEFLLDEISTSDPSDYLLRIAIQVKPK